MSSLEPNVELTKYIEQQASEGRPVVDIARELLAVGWGDDQIVSAMQLLNQEHDVLGQMHLGPPSHPPNSYRNLVIGVAVAVVVALLLVLLFRSPGSAVDETFADRNYSMQLPATWRVPTGHSSGALETTFFSREQTDEATRHRAATLTLHALSGRDQEGAKLVLGNSDAEIVGYSIMHKGPVEYRYIQFRKQDGDMTMRGAFVLATRGRLSMSATVTTAEQYWSDHADEAERMLLSITPACSKPPAEVEINTNGTVHLCR